MEKQTVIEDVVEIVDIKNLDLTCLLTAHGWDGNPLDYGVEIIE